MLLSCTKCTRQEKRRSANMDVAFVCSHCRCGDCQIVFNIVCGCDEIHGVRSEDNTTICTECFTVRERLVLLDPEMLALRQESIEAQGDL